MLDVTVKRSEWYRGKGSDRSRLLIADGPSAGQMCCLGFAALASGLTEKQITNVPMPMNLVRNGTVDISDLHSALQACVDGSDDDEGEEWQDSAVGNDLAEFNDDPEIDDPTREERLISAGAEIGINFTFVD